MHKAFVVHQLAFGKGGIDIAIGPFLRRLAHGHLAGLSTGKVFAGPLERLELNARGTDVAIGARIGLVRVQALQRVDVKRQGLVMNFDFVERVLQRGFVFGRQQQDRRTDITGLVGQQLSLRCRRVLDLVGCQDADHAGHLERLVSVDLEHPRMRIGAA